MANATATDVQKAYLAYFGRPADPVGLAYWTGKDVATMKAGFAASAEYTALYAGMSTTQMVAQVYQNLLGREAELAGLLYWAGEMSAGRQTVTTLVDAIQTNALGNDVTTINNRVTYATAFTAALDTTAEVIGYSGNTAAAAARTAVTAVLDTTASLTAAQTALATSVATVVAGGASSSGSTFTLTNGADTGTSFTGGTGADTFNGVLGKTLAAADGTTFNPGDNLNGSTGTDALNLSIAGTIAVGGDADVSAVTLTSIERLAASNYETSANTNTINLSNATGLTTIALAGSSATGDTLFTGVQNIVAAEMSSGSGDLSITYADAAVTGSADTQNLTLSGVTGGTFTAAATATGGVETLAITSSGSAANVLTGITNAATLTKFTVAGTQDVTLGTLQAAVITVDASASTGGVIATAGQGVNYAITGGKGNDVLTVTAGNVGATDTITGGTGTDTIKLDAAVTAANAANISGFEVLDVTTNNVAQTMAGLLSGVTKLVSSATSDGGGQVVSFTNVGSGVTDLQVTGTEGIVASLATNTSADAVTVTYGTSTAGFTVAGQTTLNDYETISIVSQGGANNTGAFNANSVTKLNVSGSKALTLGATTAASLATINASGMTAAFVMSDNSSTTASSITGGTGNDKLYGSTLVDTIVGGSGDDSIYGSAGADSLSGGDGNDTFTVATVAHFTTGVETVVGGAGNDTLSIEQAATVTTVTAANLGAISGIETLSINSTSAAASVTLNDAVFTANGQTLAIVDADLTTAGGTLTVDGSALTSANSISVTANTATGINDTLTGGAGNDSFTFSTTAGLEATDTVVGGTGTDTIFLTASADVTANLTGVRTVENITTTGTGGNIVITVGSDSVIAASSTLTTTAASSTTTGNTLNYNGSAVTTATKVQNVTGSAGTDTIIGGSGNDILVGGDSADKLTGGAGVDSLSGGAGDDLIYVDTAAQFVSLASAETVSGGSGNDTLVFATGVGFTVAAADLAAINSVETLQFLSTASNDTVTLTDAVFTANGATSLKIDAAAVTSGNFGLAASALSAANSVTVTRTNNGADGGDSIVFGAGNDVLKVATSILDNTTTTLTGGTGNDTITLTETGQTVTMTALTTGFEKIDFGADIAAAITTVDANVASGVTFTVDGAALITTNALTFNGSAELDGKFTMTGGAAADVLTGGALADTISGGSGADTITGGKAADSLTGGAGADVFAYTSASVTDSTGTTYDTITDFTTTSDKIKMTLDYSAVSAGVDVNANLVASTADLSAKRGEFVYDTATSLLSINVNNDNLITTQDIKISLATVVAGDVNMTITGTTFGDTIVGGSGADVIATNGGADTVTGGAGADSMTGGGGVDVFKWTATTAATFATEANTNAGATATFAAGSVGDKVATFTTTADKLYFAAAGLTNAVGTENDTADVIAAAGTVTNTARFVIVSTNQADLTFATAVTLLDGLTTTAVAIGDSFIAAIDNGTDSALYYVKQVSASNTIAAQDVTLIGQVVGTAQLANGDFVSF